MLWREVKPYLFFRGLPLLTTDYEESVPSEVNDDETVRSMSSKTDFVPDRKKRDSWVVVTHDAFSNDSVVREFKFEVVWFLV